MNYWHEIIKDYDNIDGEGSDKYIYSESSAVMVLMLLTFGEDYAYKIAKTFAQWGSPNELFRGSVLKNPNKMTVLLNKMHEDGFILGHVTIIRGRETKIYKINPKIIRSPTNSYPYEKHDGTVLEIPQELVERFLTWLSEDLAQSSIKEELASEPKILKDFDLITFLRFIKLLALQWEEKPEVASEFATRPRLSQLIEEYIIEVELHSDQYIRLFEYILQELERIGFPQDERTIIIENGKIKVSKHKPRG
jgi:hypothetical protein